VRATHDFLSEDDIVALRPLVEAALDDDALDLWVLTEPGDRPVGFMGLAGEDISALFQISVNLIMEVVQMWHASFQTPPEGSEGLEGVEGTDSNGSEQYRPRHRPQDDA